MSGMMGRDIVALITNEARWKASTRELVEKAFDYTDEEVDALQVPLKWYKEAIKEMRRRKAQEVSAEAASEAAEGYADTMGGFVETPMVVGDLVQYTGHDVSGFTPARGLKIALTTGMHFFVTEADVWLDATCLGSRNNVQLPWTVVESGITRNQYAHFVLTGKTQ